MKRLVLLVVILLLPVVAQAEPAKISWNQELTYTDNTAIPAGNLVDAFFRIYVGDDASGGVSGWTRIPDANYVVTYPATSTILDVPVGKYVTIKFVVRCDASLPMTQDNKCPSGYAVPGLFESTTPPPPPPPATGGTPVSPSGVTVVPAQ